MSRPRHFASPLPLGCAFPAAASSSGPAPRRQRDASSRSRRRRRRPILAPAGAGPKIGPESDSDDLSSDPVNQHEREAGRRRRRAQAGAEELAELATLHAGAGESSSPARPPPQAASPAPTRNASIWSSDSSDSDQHSHRRRRPPVKAVRGAATGESGWGGAQVADAFCAAVEESLYSDRCARACSLRTATVAMIAPLNAPRVCVLDRVCSASAALDRFIIGSGADAESALSPAERVSWRVHALGHIPVLCLSFCSRSALLCLHVISCCMSAGAIPSHAPPPAGLALNHRTVITVHAVQEADRLLLRRAAERAAADILSSSRPSTSQ